MGKSYTFGFIQPPALLSLGLMQCNNLAFAHKVLPAASFVKFRETAYFLYHTFLGILLVLENPGISQQLYHGFLNGVVQ